MNKVIIVTGASRGIGREISRELAKKGYIIIANYNKSEKQILELKEELEKEKVKIDIFKVKRNCCRNGNDNRSWKNSGNDK